MELIIFLTNNLTMALLGLAGFGLVAFSILISRASAPIRIPIRIDHQNRK